MNEMNFKLKAGLWSVLIGVVAFLACDSIRGYWTDWEPATVINKQYHAAWAETV